MQRLLSTICLLCLPLAGCGQLATAGTKAYPPGTFTPAIAAEVSYASLNQPVNPNPSPTPNPNPQPGICQNCNGSGKVGDGTVMTICPVCEGSGKVVNAAPPFEQQSAKQPLVTPAVKQTDPLVSKYGEETAQALMALAEEAKSLAAQGKADDLVQLVSHGKRLRNGIQTASTPTGSPQGCGCVDNCGCYAKGYSAAHKAWSDWKLAFDAWSARNAASAANAGVSCEGGQCSLQAGDCAGGSCSGGSCSSGIGQPAWNYSYGPSITSGTVNSFRGRLLFRGGGSCAGGSCR